jgi:hypothetical protein
MNLEQMKALLMSFEGATFAGLDTVTVPTLKGGKANPFQGKLAKHCNGSRVMLFTNKKSSGYENKVKRHLEKAGLDPESFQMGALPWGERLPNSPLIVNKEKHYLQCVFLEAGTVEYRATEEIITNGFLDVGMSHYCNGDYVPKENIPGLSDKTGSEHQGLERDSQVIVRTYALESIVALRAMGEQLD